MMERNRPREIVPESPFPPVFGEMNATFVLYPDSRFITAIAFVCSAGQKVTLQADSR